MNNDRFKFRVWDKTNNEYRRNSYIWTINQIGYLTNDNTVSLTSFSEEPDFEYVIEQCTGLKDKNGKLIFEGDLIEDEDKITWEVFRNNKALRFVASRNGEDDRYSKGVLLWEDCEIIGTIHDKE